MKYVIGGVILLLVLMAIGGYATMKSTGVNDPVNPKITPRYNPNTQIQPKPDVQIRN